MEDFNSALAEITPAFGSDKASLESYRINGMIRYSETFDHLHKTTRMLVGQVICVDSTSVGHQGCCHVPGNPKPGGRGFLSMLLLMGRVMP